jgi:hypothetical protein
MRRFVLFSLVAAVALLLAAPRPALGQKSLSFQDLAGRMVDLDISQRYLKRANDAPNGQATIGHGRDDREGRGRNPWSSRGGE